MSTILEADDPGVLDSPSHLLSKSEWADFVTNRVKYRSRYSNRCQLRTKIGITKSDDALSHSVWRRLHSNRVKPSCKSWIHGRFRAAENLAKISKQLRAVKIYGFNESVCLRPFQAEWVILSLCPNRCCRANEGKLRNSVSFVTRHVVDRKLLRPSRSRPTSRLSNRVDPEWT